MGEIRFVGDPHLGHRLVADLRGFASVDAHDHHILSAMAAVATPETIWWHTGDEAFDGWQGRITAFSAIPGTHHLVLGNHDRAFPSNSNAHLQLAGYQEVFASVQLSARISYAGIKVLISHFPYDGDTEGREEERFEQWRLRDLGRTLIHGHTHSSQRISHSARGTLQIHAGLDAWNLKPPTIHDLLSEAGLL
ncbi:MAG: metallophosphoesterase family protein [Propionicimonas sp.]